MELVVVHWMLLCSRNTELQKQQTLQVITTYVGASQRWEQSATIEGKIEDWHSVPMKLRVHPFLVTFGSSQGIIVITGERWLGDFFR